MSVELVDQVMLDFAKRTGLDPIKKHAIRYLWTDSFAVCNFLELYRKGKNDYYLKLALSLVGQVHHTLGRHREDDDRTGWISGLVDEEAEDHPTMGGLRIGKPLRERRADESPDSELEWEQDGQYYHYLTKWMHALDVVCRTTREPKYGRWAMELAKVAHAAFTYSPDRIGRKRMYWKMSIDLSRPQVTSMGLHDPLDGYVAYLELQRLASVLPINREGLDLKAEVIEMASMCKDGDWVTEDPLGTGGLLFDACRIGQLIASGDSGLDPLLDKVLDAALPGLESFSSGGSLNLPARYRLAFRELGLSIGLKGVRSLQHTMESNPTAFGPKGILQRRTIDILALFATGLEIE